MTPLQSSTLERLVAEPDGAHEAAGILGTLIAAFDTPEECRAAARWCRAAAASWLPLPKFLRRGLRAAAEAFDRTADSIWGPVTTTDATTNPLAPARRIGS